ncbi:MAG: DUF488 family protein [Candidatus Binataceae bacterium]
MSRRQPTMARGCWPIACGRWMTKEAVRVRQWMKELGPSDRLRRFFGHDSARWEDSQAQPCGA